MAYDARDEAYQASQGDPDVELDGYVADGVTSDADLGVAADGQSWSYYADDESPYGEYAADGTEADQGYVLADGEGEYAAIDGAAAEAVPYDEGLRDDPDAMEGAYSDAGRATFDAADGEPVTDRPDDLVYAFDDDAAAANEAQVDGYDLYAAGEGQTGESDELSKQDETRVLPPLSANGYVPVTRPEKLAQYHAAPRPAAPEPYRQQDKALASLLEEDPEAEAAYRALVSRREDRKRRRRVYAVVAAVAVLTAVAVFALRDRFAATQGDDLATAPTLYTVAREDFTSTVQSSGALQPASSVVVTPEVAGIISEVRVKEGDMVSEGDVLFVLKNDEISRAVTDANDRLKAAESTASSAAAAVTNAYNAYNSAVDAYNASLAAGQADAAFDEITLRAAITTAETARDSANAAVSEARAALDEANKQADKLTVKAPISGAVVSLGAVVGAAVGGATGATAQATSSTLAQIADISQMKVTVQVNEIDISTISAGQQARVTFSAVPDLELEATVESIASVASGAGEDGVGVSGGIVTYAVVLVINEPDAKLKPGMTASVTIVTQDVQDALVIPVSAVSEQGDTTYVDVVVDEKTFATESRQVTLGARSSTEVVVEQGLSEGDVILLAGSGDGLLTEGPFGDDDDEMVASTDMAVA